MVSKLAPRIVRFFESDWLRRQERKKEHFETLLLLLHLRIQ
jgi:hypothetical protein